MENVLTNDVIIKNLGNEGVPKKILLETKFWYVNAALLSDYNFDRAVIFVATSQLNNNDLLFVAFLSFKYLISYIEVYTFDPTSLLMLCIEKQLKFLLVLLGKQKKAKKLISYNYIIETQNTFELLFSTEIDNHICRQMYIDYIEQLCILFASRLKIWQKNPILQANLYRYNFNPYRSAVIYNIFLIPNQNNYVNPILRMDQKFINKIETKCHCKILLTVENLQCHLTPEFVSLDVTFDLYKGNYIGFLDMFYYIIKLLNSTIYFVKSLRTILIEGSLLYNILTNVPIKKLKFLEKNIIAGLPIAPFLDATSSSKQLYSVLAIIEKEGNSTKTVGKPQRLDSMEDENESDSLKYYDLKDDGNDLKNLKLCVKNVKDTEQLLKIFQIKYENSINYSTRQKNPNYFNINKNKRCSKKDKNSTTRISIPKVKDDEFKNEIEYKPTNKINDKYMLPTLPFPTYGSIGSNVSNETLDFQGNLRFQKFNMLHPQEQFDIIMKHNLNTYSTEVDWVNHQMRRMMRCDTKETEEDLLYPYRFQNIKFGEKTRKNIKCSQIVNFIPSRKPSYKGLSTNLISRSINAEVPNVWLSKEATLILTSGIETHEDISEYETFSSSNLTIDANIIEEVSPKISEFLSNCSLKIKDKIVVNKLYLQNEWVKFLSMNTSFSQIPMENMSENFSILNYFSKVVEILQPKLLNFETVSIKNIHMLLYFLTNGEITIKLFTKLMEGTGVYFPILQKINTDTTCTPVKVESEITPDLMNCLCQLIYDLNLLGQYSVDELIQILKYHISILIKLIKNCEKNIKVAFEILLIVKKLKSVIRIKEDKQRNMMYNHNILMFAKELNTLYDILFKIPCNILSTSKNVSMRILYHSLEVDSRLSIVEPFLRLPHDNRLKEIEEICNCCVALRVQKSETIAIEDCIIDIYYDFENGNHFKVLELFKSTMNFQHRLMTIQKHRTLVLFPTGELWTFKEFEWMKSSVTV